VDSVVRLQGGANNLVFRAATAADDVVVKAYFHDVDDPRDRLHTEYNMLRFLWSHDLRCVPEPIAVDWNHRIALYRYVEGQRPKPEDLDRGAVVALADLLLAMWRLRKEAGATDLPQASEACPALSDYARAAWHRLGQLLSHLHGGRGIDKDASTFVRGELQPRLERIEEALVEWQAGRQDRESYGLTLSPSDHGFHNALKTADGSWFFFDFEYSGWDDPAKMLADALLQPEVRLPAALHRPFLEYVLAESAEGVEPRLRKVLPAVHLKWCLTMLNVFLPAAQRRREFALSGLDLEKLKTVQLAKARREFDERYPVFTEPGFFPGQ